MELMLGVLPNTPNVKTVDFVVDETTNHIRDLGFSVSAQKLSITPGGQDTLLVTWDEAAMLTRSSENNNNVAIEKKIRNWVDVERQKETSFSITAKVDTKTYVWNVYSAL